jgi:hypothetical protein
MFLAGYKLFFFVKGNFKRKIKFLGKTLNNICRLKNNLIQRN